MSKTQGFIRRGPHLTEQVYLALCQGLVSGEYVPGQALVIEHVAVQLGVSPTPVREALARLLEKGLIVQTPNGKLQVIQLTERYVRDMFLVRSALEGLGAELATLRITAEQLSTLRQMLADTTASLAEGNYEVYSQSDAYLHDLIKEAADNTILKIELEALKWHIDFIRGYSQRHAGSHVSASHQEHLAILEAFSNRDPVGAREATEHHIRNASERIVQLIDFHNDRLRASSLSI